MLSDDGRCELERRKGRADARKNIFFVRLSLRARKFAWNFKRLAQVAARIFGIHLLREGNFPVEAAAGIYRRLEGNGRYAVWCACARAADSV
jgi:hypothetical protein